MALSASDMDLINAAWSFVTTLVVGHLWLENLKLQAMNQKLAETMALTAKEVKRIESKLDGMLVSLRIDIRYAEKLSDELMNRLLTIQGEMKSTHTIVNAAPGAPMADPIAQKMQEDLMDILGVNVPKNGKNPD